MGYYRDKTAYDDYVKSNKNFVFNFFVRFVYARFFWNHKLCVLFYIFFIENIVFLTAEAHI